MQVSIVILNWNRATDTVAAVESCLAQSHRIGEILVYDNASSDDSVETLTNRFGDREEVRIVVGDDNYGVAGGRNRAFALAQGQVVLSLDSDAVFANKDAAGEAMRVLERDSEIGIVAFDVRRPDGHLMWPFARPSAEWESREFDTIRIDGCAFAVRKRAFEQVEGFAEHFSPYGAEDQHFAAKIIGAGYSIRYVPSASILHAFSPHGRSPIQFRRHVRNSLWIPMELFPAHHAAVSFIKQAVSLLRDAMEERKLLSYAAGCLDALFTYRPSRRRAIPPERWRYLRSLVEDDKREARRT